MPTRDAAQYLARRIAGEVTSARAVYDTRIDR
jgi:hypothetical protein